MKHEAEYFLTRTTAQTLVLAVAGGMFITLGALFSLLLSDGLSTPGTQLLMQGLGFSTGFFMIILSRSALFTEANVIFPVSYLQGVPAIGDSLRDIQAAGSAGSKRISPPCDCRSISATPAVPPKLPSI